MQYTVFGRVIEGMDVLDAICAAQVERSPAGLWRTSTMQMNILN